MKAHLDADILLYELGSCTDDEGQPLRWSLTQARLEGVIKKIIDASGADEYVMYLTGKDNFRNDIATIKPYKGHRISPKPFHYQKIKDYLQSSKKHKVITVDGYEADDAMSIAQYDSLFNKGEVDGSIICSRDKDLRMVPGWHYSWASGKQKEKDPFYVSEVQGWRWFFTQLLTGDPTDNIPGLYKIGPKHAETHLAKADNELGWYDIVQHQYECRFGSYWELFMHENARLLWMLRHEGDDIVENTLKIFEQHRQYKLKEDF